MPRDLVKNDWRRLSKAARRERNPIKFVYLVKQLYDVVNEGDEEHRVSRRAKPRQVKRAPGEHELKAA